MMSDAIARGGNSDFHADAENPDDLRTRIAAALRTMTGDLTYEAMADAVIRELDSEGLLIDSEAGDRLNRMEGRR